MANWDLAGLATLVKEPQAVLVTRVKEIGSAQSGDSADPSGSVDKGRDDRPVAEPDDVALRQCTIGDAAPVRS